MGVPPAPPRVNAGGRFVALLALVRDATDVEMLVAISWEVLEAKQQVAEVL